jgi:hypothetical protein
MAQDHVLRREPARGLAQSRTAGTYGVLVRHFFDRFSDNESLAPQADASANLGATLALLAMPGAFLVFLLLSVTLSGWGLVTFRYFYISYTMLTMAFIVVFRWGALFPDARDYLILTPLPLRTITVFAAKVSALAIILALFLLDVTIFGMLMWPAVDRTGGNPWRVMASHATATGAAGIFGALAATALQGIFVTILPQRVFRWLSAWVQTLLMALLIMLLFLTPLLAHAVKPLALTKSPLFDYFPGLWFLGVYELLLPATNNRVLLDAGYNGLQALAWAALIVLCTYVPGYRRHSRNAAGTSLPHSGRPGFMRSAFERSLNRLLLRHPGERAVFWFITQTIARSMKHRVFLATYAGFGAALAVLSYFSGPLGALRLPLTLSFVLVSGLRAAFSVPSELRANWSFQISGTDTATSLRAMRKWIAICAIGPLFAIMLPVELLWFPWQPALFHVAFGITLSLLLIDVMFAGFRKVAFTCSYFPGRMNMVGLAVLYVCGFTFYSSVFAMLEAWLLTEPAAAATFFAVAAAAGFLLARRNEREAADGSALEYEDPGEPAVRTLELSAS